MIPSPAFGPRVPGAPAFWKLLTAVAASLGCAVASGQTVERGDLFSSTFTSEDYGAHQQNWQVAQGLDGVIYVANPQGVLVFDGARWECVPHPEQAHVTGIACSEAGELFYGTAGDVGRLERTADGDPRFVSLLDRLEEPLALGFVQQVLATPDGIYFAAGRHLLRWTPAEERMRVWGVEGKAQAYASVSWIGNECIVAMIGRGLLAVDGDELVPLPGAEALESVAMEVAAVLPWDEGDLLLATVRSGLFLYDGETARRWDSSINEQLTGPDPPLLCDCLALRDGRFVVATLREGAWVFERDGTVARHLGPSTAMLSANVLDAHQDAQGGLWLSTSGGLVRFEVESPLERFGREHGLDGNVLALARRAGTFYAGTDVGLFVLDPPGSPGGTARFRRIATREIHDLVAVEDRLFGATGDALIELDSDLGVQSWPLRANRLALDPVGGYLYAGTETYGVYRLDLGEDGPPVPWLEDPPSVQRLVWAPTGELWFAAHRPNLQRDLIRAVPGSTEPVTTLYDEARGLPFTHNLDVFVWNGELLVGTADALFRPAGDRLVPDLRMELAAGEPLGVMNPEVDGRGRLWFWSGEGEAARAELLGDGLRVDRPLQRVGRVNFLEFFADGDSVWAGAGSGRLVRYRQPIRPRDRVPPAVVQRVFSMARPDRAVGSAGTSASPRRLPYVDNSLRFEFASPSYDGPELNEYRTRLFGLEEAWSGWSSATYRDFTELWEGEYRFEVQARDAHGRAGPSTTYAFRLQPPAARTWWAYAGYVALLLAFITTLVRVRVRATRRQLDLLRAQIRQREQAQREREALADQLRQAQKMESLGLLAGGISHDFNNLLTVILANAEMLSHLAAEQAWSDESLLESIEEIRETGDRAAALTHQLLAFSRKQDLAPKLVDPNESITAVEGLLRRLVRKDVELRMDLDAEPGRVLVDPGQLEQILINLVINASDAMRGGGTVIVSTRRFDRAGPLTNPDEPPPGAHVRLSVADTGPGIDAETLPRVFEPFFTTKAEGEGTGLGLASVHGIIEQSGGHVRVVSEVGRGTTFDVFLPRVDEEPSVKGNSEVHGRADQAASS